MKNKYTKKSVLFFAFSISAIISACALNESIMKQHPVKLESEPKCSECHSDNKSLTALDHTSNFINKHKYCNGKQLCIRCHKESFCIDCHANKEELRPSDKYKDKTDRVLPHRGDYITQHKIDGKINASQCMKCHGYKNNEECKKCHK